MPPTTTVFERGDRVYIVSALAEAAPTPSAIEEYAFGKDIIAGLREQAPNDYLSWFAGHYVQGDEPNMNGAMFLSSELAVKSLTPMFCPVTIMHDPRTAVGLIADVRLTAPPEVQKAKIETALALWKHRFPDAVSEAHENARQGTLMQSMEALAPIYDCSVCGSTFHKLPKGAEKANWCDHLKASDPSAGYNDAKATGKSNASRTLRNVTFTGTGLIFGSRGAIGADPSANLEAFMEEVAEFHDKSHRDSSYKPKPIKNRSSKRMAEIDDREYAELLSAKSERETLKTRVATLEVEAAKVPDLEKNLEAAEAAKVAAETAKTAAETAKADLEEKANRQTLRDERWETIGSSLKEKLDSMPTTKGNLLRDAEQMEDAPWEARLTEVEESTGIKRDAQKEPGKEGDKTNKDEPTFTPEEVAAFKGGGKLTTPVAQSPAERRSVVAGLSKPRTPAKKS